ncbi:MAG: hypothetical protein HXY30_03435 [Pseudorhodoplanes sp.]|nr:hypothetical protein [Pseudorhodoplanes sp.]
MSDVIYRIVRHDEGSPRTARSVFFEPFPTDAAALAAAKAAAAEQRVPRRTEAIDYEDADGRWRIETAWAGDRPDSDVEHSSD